MCVCARTHAHMRECMPENHERLQKTPDGGLDTCLLLRWLAMLDSVSQPWYSIGVHLPGLALLNF